MKRMLRWFAKVLSTAVTIALLIVMFPHISRLAEKWLPDESGAAVRTSMILASRLEESARLESLKVQEEGVLNYDIKAAFIGTVAQINITYTYEGSFGIDLSKVDMRVEENTITFLLPAPELIQDVLTPDEVYKDDFWYPGFSEEDYTKLLEDQRLACREAYLSGEKLEQLWEASQKAFENTITAWLKELNSSIVTRYERAVPTTE